MTKKDDYGIYGQTLFRTPLFYYEQVDQRGECKNIKVRHPPQSGWLDEWGCLKGS